ncbi:methyl-accepting chemotaxis protein [Pseudorhodoferax sp. Leaf274]|uniref:methyl-accepting chemotaxis protein n=1 Tax=Pseudorhodoferax sp. Leaf274 TaxID=1736318 RepID=UPI000703000F|nr:methyl-accepting chemotaxis protein [Pseudorhodoferax sp. Leaf274]KQP49188.1 hypothetical protein ASF44_00770 [Pseudorhodoferax sp. Leaf274]
MNFLKNFKLGTRLATGFGAVLSLLVLVGLLGIHSMGQVQSRLEDIANVHNKAASLAVAMRIAVNQVAIASRDIVLLEDQAQMQEVDAALIKSRAHYDAAEQELARMLAMPGAAQESKDLFSRILAMKATTRPLIDKLVALGLENKNAEAVQVLSREVTGPQKTWLLALGEFAAQQEQQTLAATKEAEAAYASARAWVFVLCCIGLAFGIAAAWLITLSITRPIARAVEVAETVSAGDLTSQIEVTGKDETSRLLAALQAMNQSLVRVVGTVRASSDNIATGATQIAAGNADLSQRTEEQAANLQQTAASMEELTSTVQSNSETARQATQLAASASAVAKQGGVVVGQVVSTMQAITESSKKISDIIGVVDGIAFQTNILALNAAVEAARAGEQGRGFAVVASEVRSLAGRSAEAAKEIKQLIGASVEKVETGSRLVADAGATMGDIVGQVQRVADLIGEISAATGEQTQGISQISDAVMQLDQVTQQNAALVEESAAAADSLNQQTVHLVEAVSVFKLANVAAVPTAASAPAVERTAPAPRSPAPRPAAPGAARKATALQAAKRPAAAARPELAMASAGTDPGWEAF